MTWPKSIRTWRPLNFLFILLMNLTALPLMLIWTIVGISLFPVLFLSLKAVTSWNAEQITRRLIWIYGRGWLAIMLPFTRPELIGINQDKMKPPCIYVANHLSFFDIYCLAVLPSFNVSIAIRNWPFKMYWYSPFMHMAGYLNIEKMSWGRFSQSAAQILSKGGALLFFPEGHRSRDGQLQQFYSGPFRLAAETGFKIVPICIQGTNEVLPPGRWWLKPAKVTIKALDPVDPKSYTESAAHRLIRKNVKNMMTQGLSEMDLNKGMGGTDEPRPAWGS